MENPSEKLTLQLDHFRRVTSLERRSKGTPASFVMHLFESRRAEIGEMLCDGLLAGHGLVDRDRVHTYLSDPRPVSDARYMQIMGLVDAESWARSWTR